MPVTYRIHPAIGIARVGDSPDDFFIGPEAPRVPPTLDKPDGSSSQPGKYKDQQHRIKRQGARFRIYEYTEDAAGVVTKVREITSTEAQIEWEVCLANRKAAAPKLDGPGRRNANVPESDLIIDPGPQRLSGVKQAMKKLQGKFMKSIDVQLGDLLTDSAGRLIVLGGHGKSQSPSNRKVVHFADNDGWCDDVSDGPVRATIRLTGSAAPIDVDSAWVIVAPPDFAPAIENVVTLYDVVYNVMAGFDPRLAVSDTSKVSFTKDIYPILRRVSHMHWVSEFAAMRHGKDKDMHFISRLKDLSSKTQGFGLRDRIFKALRTPQGGGGNMPFLPPSVDDPKLKIPGAALTATQYKRLELWAQGKFDADWSGAEPAPTPFDKLPDKNRPQALDRAALEACVGGPFFPGIEASRLILDETTYDKKRPFRINATLDPGRLTATMAVPWQADFRDCTSDPERGSPDWWPGQRPNQVRRGQEHHAAWAPPGWKFIDMVEKWAQLRFVVAKTVENNVEYVEEVEDEPPSAKPTA
jgi:L-Lysine epsilon oxidase N-terminal/L-lysine epsilon oxidase C-terminal domain